MKAFEPTREFAILMDERNRCETRASFHIPSAKEVSQGKSDREEAIYMCGNSLGMICYCSSSCILHQLVRTSTEITRKHIAQRIGKMATSCSYGSF